MKLDVGCGHRPSGDINVDLYVMPTVHRSIRAECPCAEPLAVKSIPNFIVADAEHLPFISDCFDEVYSAHTIEHVSKPFTMLKEMVRVTKEGGYVEIQCPHRYGAAKVTGHKNFFGVRWFVQALKKCNLAMIKCDVEFRNFPNKFLPFVSIPTEIHVVGRKLKKTVANPC